MKIAINAINAKSYGITNYTIQLINSLIKNYSKDIEITLFISSSTTDRFDNLNEICRVKTVSLNSTATKTLFTNFILPFKLWGFDIVHSVANLGILITPIPQIITIHDAYEVKSPERFSLKKRAYMQLVISISGIFAKKIVAVSNNTKNDLQEYYKFLSSKIVSIYSGCNFPILSPSEMELEKQNYLLFVGTIEPGKNLITLLEAFRELEKKSDIELKIVGAKEWKQSEEICNSLPKSAIFLGKVSNLELIELYKNAKALVFPSLYEGFGFPVIEAMANGCPVIAANNSAIPEAGGEVALYFKTTDSKELETVLQDFLLNLHNKSYVKESVKKGIEQAQKFSWDKTAKKMWEIYNGN